MLRMSVGSYKNQHPVKNGVPNADMTMADRHFLGVFDGVSGVADHGHRPENYSWDLRNAMRHYFRQRVFSESAEQFGKEVSSIVGPAGPAKGSWLRNLLVLAMSDCQLAGATTLGVMSVMGKSVSWLHVGDVQLTVLRPFNNLRKLHVVFQSRDQRRMIRTADGREVECPSQVGIMSAEDMTMRNWIALASQADFGKVGAQAGDVLVACSDGITDNINQVAFLQKLPDLYFANCSPTEMAKELCEMGVASGVKPDDNSCAIGILCQM